MQEEKDRENRKACEEGVAAAESARQKAEADGK